ncbi:MAG: RND transporter [Nitrospirales bacterium]|nr:MAG: RND transporter [Nitrospirales bacterium]
MKFKTCAAIIVNRPWLTIGFVALLVTIVSVGSGGLTFRSDDRIFFSDDNPELQDLHRFEEKYGREDTIVFVITAKDGDLFTPEKLAIFNDVTDRAWHFPYVKRVDSVTNFQRVSAEGDEVIIDHLARSGDTITDAHARLLKDAAQQEPLLLGRLLSTDGTVGLVNVQFWLNDELAGDMAGELMEHARNVANELRRQYDMVTIRISGSLALDNAFGEASARDGMVLTPMMFGLIFGLIGWIFRSSVVVGAAFLVIGGAIGAALGTAGFLSIPLSPPSVSAPFMILTLATADCIHLTAAVFRRARQNPAGDRRTIVWEGLCSTFRPITLTSATTAIGFFSLIFSESPPFGHLGVIAAIGVLYAWLLAVTVLPALLVVLPWQGTAHGLLVPDAWWERLHGVLERQPGLIIGVSLFVGLGMSVFAFTNVLDDRYVKYFDQSFAFRTDTDYMNQHLGGFYALEYSLNSGRPEGIFQPDYLQQVDAFVEWMRQQSGVTHVTALSDVMRTINRGMNGGSQAAYVLPEDSSRAAQYLWLYEMSLPRGLDLHEQVTIDKAESRMTVSLEDLSTQEVLVLAERARNWVDANAPAFRDSARATGTTVLFSHIGQRNIDQMLTGTFAALLLISAILFVIFRSFSLGGAAVATNLVPPLAALGGWALFVGEVGMAVATIAAVTLGIVVDDTIHFVEATRRGQREGLNPNHAVLYALKHAGEGIVVTTVILVVGFACLAFSGFQINAWMGLMTAIVIGVALVFDLLFLPSILIKTRS